MEEEAGLGERPGRRRLWAQHNRCDLFGRRGSTDEEHSQEVIRRSEKVVSSNGTKIKEFFNILPRDVDMLYVDMSKMLCEQEEYLLEDFEPFAVLKRGGNSLIDAPTARRHNSGQ